MYHLDEEFHQLEGQHKLTKNGAFFECNFSEGKQTKICSPIQN